MADKYLLSRRRIILFACFLAGGIGIGTWGANLPALGRRADLSEGALGIVLLSFAAGAILAMTNAPSLIRKIGAERMSVVAVGLFGCGIASIGLISHMVTAVIVAGLSGLSFGSLDVAMNSRAAYLERQAKRPIMSSFHAMFSAGTLLAALTYAALVHLEVANEIVLALSGFSLVSIATGAFSQTTPHRSEDLPSTATDRVQSKMWISSPALILGAFAFVIFLAEGAIMDWAAVYMVRVLGTTESVAATGYAVFAGTMLLGRLIGDKANRAFGAPRLFRFCIIAITFSMAAFLLSGSVASAFVALAFCGLAMANAIPILFSAAGVLGASDGDRSLSQVLTMGYAGILLGPALIGFVAQASSLRLSLSLILFGLVLVAIFARAMSADRATQ
ncbi:MFS transporter [Paracoccus liaowanqingii]|uniref:MFS transporter n=1 Tax=Paracoccus liaowanqingii TaxID=2560053 RepID=A0A4Z1CQG2_9RHOB|nr:MFS transporter [Paracoccus liaowanqingii]TGN67202.1 MFS transporter [Paracoccus liaowanqingii]